MAQIKEEIVEMVTKLENERYIKYLWTLCKTFLKNNQLCPPLPAILLYNSIVKKHQEKPKGISQVLFSCRKISTERRKRRFESDR